MAARLHMQDPADHARVRELIGREPKGHYTIVVRTSDGDPVVLRNAPILHDGSPMPTLYWLVGAHEVREVSRLEAEGVIDEVEALMGLDVIADIHDRYAHERNADIPFDHVGPTPFGGVAGTRVGVKCLHAHFAWWLAGGNDVIGEWTAQRLTDRGIQFASKIT